MKLNLQASWAVRVKQQALSNVYLVPDNGCLKKSVFYRIGRLIHRMQGMRSNNELRSIDHR